MPQDDSRFDDSANAARFREALASLPPLPREAFRLHRVDGFSYAETGRRLGLTAGEVERLIAEALVRLDRALNRPTFFYVGRRLVRMCCAGLGVRRRKPRA